MRSIEHTLVRLLGVTTAAIVVITACGGQQAPSPAPSPSHTSTPRSTATAVQPSPVPTKAEPQATATTVPNVPNPKYGGILNRRIQTEPPSFNPLGERTFDTQDIAQTTYDQLVQYDPQDQNKIVPQLAESWTTSSDGKVYTFRIRKGIQFQNGYPLTAADLKYTYELVKNPPKGFVSLFGGMLATVESIQAPDEGTLVINLKERDASFLAGIGFGRMAVVSKGWIDTNGLERLGKWPPMGTGPFVGKPDGYLKGVSVETAKNGKYFVEGRPYLDGMKYFIIPDEGTAFAAFLGGQLNWGWYLKPRQADEARARLGDKLYIQEQKSLTWWSIEINTLQPPFTDVRLRKAVAYAADKYAVIKAGAEGLGSVGGFLAAGSGWELPQQELEQFAGYKNDRAGNLAAAKKLLVEAGYPNGLSFTYFTNNSNLYIDHTIVVKGLLDEAGIKGEINIVDTAKYYAEQGGINAPGKAQAWQATVGGHRSLDTDPNLIYRDFVLPDAPRNTPGLRNDPKITELYNAQNAATDAAQRKRLVWDMERYVLGLYPQAIFYYAGQLYAWKAEVKNHRYHVSYIANEQFRDVWIER